VRSRPRTASTGRRLTPVRRLIATLALVLGGCGPQDPAREPPPSEAHLRRLAAAHCPTVRPYFYRIEKAGTTSYLLGTRHLGVGLGRFPATVAAHLRTSQLAVFEISPDDPKPPPPPPDPARSLAADLGPQAWRRYRTLVGAAVAAKVDHLPPWFAVVAPSVMFVDASASLERELAQVAREAHVAMAGLETYAFQRGLLERWLDLRLLRAIIASAPTRQVLEDHAMAQLERYCQGVFDGEAELDEVVSLEGQGYDVAEVAAAQEAMVFGRTRAWVPQLEAWFASGGAFVAVGAAHVRGPHGLAALLRERGYVVTRVVE
jgi:hypothetical protein